MAEDDHKVALKRHRRLTWIVAYLSHHKSSSRLYQYPMNSRAVRIKEGIGAILHDLRLRVYVSPN